MAPRRKLFVAFVGIFGGAFTLAGCAHGGSKRLEGRWRGVKASGVVAEAQVRANDFATATQLEFKGDSITVTFPNEKQVGKFRVVSEEATSVDIVTDRDGAEDRATFSFAGDGTMEWAVSEGKTITFAKL